MQDAAAASGGESQALQAWSSPTHSTATTRSPTFPLSPSHFKAMLPSELDPPGSSLVHTGLLSSIGGFVSGVTSG